MEIVAIFKGTPTDFRNTFGDYYTLQILATAKCRICNTLNTVGNNKFGFGVYAYIPYEGLAVLAVNVSAYRRIFFIIIVEIDICKA